MITIRFLTLADFLLCHKEVAREDEGHEVWVTISQQDPVVFLAVVSSPSPYKVFVWDAEIRSDTHPQWFPLDDETPGKILTWVRETLPPHWSVLRVKDVNWVVTSLAESTHV